MAISYEIALQMDWIRGAIMGSFPVNGHFGACEYLNWACKFFIDSNLFEPEIRAHESKKGGYHAAG